MSGKITAKKIFDIYIPIVIVFGGTALLIYGTLLQTECFRLEYVQWSNCVIALLAGFLLGFVIMRHMKNHVSGNFAGAKKTTPMELVVMIRGYHVAFALCALVLMRAISLSFLYIGIGGMALSITSEAYYLIWLYCYNKQQGISEQ